MSNIPYLIIHSCSENVSNADFVDIDYSPANFPTVPFVTAIADTNINVHVSNVTVSSARLNFSAKYTGTVKYTAMLRV